VAASSLFTCPLIRWLANQEAVMREPAWRKTGKTPDDRFSLANERTFLAWIRTSLALRAGAVAIDQLAPNIASQPVRIVLCVVLSIIGAGLATLASRRWAQMEAALRNDQALPFLMIANALSITALACAAVAAIALGG
jgi:putative membrane protein